MRKLIAALSLLSLINTSSFAEKLPHYSIQGTVIDKTTRAPIPYANVIIWNSQIGATTDSVGHFKDQMTSLI